MDDLDLLKLLTLLLVANGTPVLVANLMGSRLAWPVDLNQRLPDGNPVFGTSKTYRGVLSSLLATALAAALLTLPPYVGVEISLFAMLGDLTSSLIKRRLGLRPSAMALGLDQIPESLFPLLAVARHFQLGIADVAGLTAAFFVVELLLSRILYRLRIRNQPY